MFSSDPLVIERTRHLLWWVAGLQGFAAVAFVLDGVLIGAGDGRYLAIAGVITVVVYAPVALFGLTLPAGETGLTWLWVSFSGVFMGARAVTLGLRARGDHWIRLGG